MIAQIVYLLCGLGSTVCALMLFRGYRKQKNRLLLWSSLGFLGLALNNLLLIYDMIIFPHGDLTVLRTIPALVGMLVMAWGLITDTVA